MKSPGNISTEFIHGPIDNPWEYFHAPKGKQMKYSNTEDGKTLRKNNLTSTKLTLYMPLRCIHGKVSSTEQKEDKIRQIFPPVEVSTSAVFIRTQLCLLTFIIKELYFSKTLPQNQ